MDIEKVKEIKRRHEDQFLNIPEVVTVEVRLVDGSPGIGIGMYEDVIDQLPSEVEGVPIEFFFVDRPDLLHGPHVDVPEETSPTAGTGKVRPVRPGTSMHNENGTACTANFLWDDPRVGLCIGSNNHCFTELNDQSTFGLSVLQPSPMDGGTSNDRVGEVYGYANIDNVDYAANSDNLLDFSWAQLDDGDDSDLEFMPGIHGIGYTNAPPKRASLGDPVSRSSRTSGLHEDGVVTAVDVTTLVGYSDYSTYIKDGFRTDTRAIGGDSGSPVVYDDGDIVSPMGITFAGPPSDEEDDYAIHCEVMNVLAVTELEIVQVMEEDVFTEGCSMTKTRVDVGEPVGLGVVHGSRADKEILFDSVATFDGEDVNVEEGLPAGDTPESAHHPIYPDTPGEYEVKAETRNVRLPSYDEPPW